MPTIQDITTRPLSGIAAIDALIDDAQPWNYIGRHVLNYSFTVGSDAGPSAARYLDMGSRGAFNDVQQAQVRAVLQYVSSVTGIQFAETRDAAAADLHFANANLLGGYTGRAINNVKYTFRGEEVTSLNVDSWIYLDNVDDVWDNLAPRPGGVGYETLLHELGHALGLKHPFEGAEQLPEGKEMGHDNTSTTLMSYTMVGGNHTTFSPYDLAALKWLYGGDGLGGAHGVGGTAGPVAAPVAAAEPQPAPLPAPAPQAAPQPDPLAAREAMAGAVQNDIVFAATGDQVIDTGEGLDVVVFGGARATYTVSRSEAGVTIRDNAGDGGTDLLVNVERIQFADAKLGLDVQGHAGQAFRLYEAALNRAPDLPGLGFHLNALDAGHALSTVAFGFLQSPEFAERFGQLDDAQFVTQLYANVLDRAPDAPGLAYHLDTLAGGLGRHDVLVGFSESPENQASLVGMIQDGISYVG